MKKVLFSVVVLVCLVMVVAAANFRSIPQISKPGKSVCTGYTIIEFDKGVDCNGDTIRLERKNGFAERVRL